MTFNRCVTSAVLTFVLLASTASVASAFTGSVLRGDASDSIFWQAEDHLTAHNMAVGATEADDGTRSLLFTDTTGLPIMVHWTAASLWGCESVPYFDNMAMCDSVPFDGTLKLGISGSSGNDRIKVVDAIADAQAFKQVFINGQDGADNLQSLLSDAPSFIIGSDGPDVMIGSAKNDKIWAADAEATGDVVVCGSGYDHTTQDAADAVSADCEE